MPLVFSNRITDKEDASPGCPKGLTGFRGVIYLDGPLLFLGSLLRSAIIYVDSRNVFHSLREKGIDGYTLNYSEFIKAVISNREIKSIKFYGARYPRSLSEKKHNADDAFYQYLEGLGIQIRLGQFKIIEEAGNRPYALEKGVDVLLATDMLVDAMYNRFDDAYILSSDTDLVPAIDSARTINKSACFHQVSVCRSPLKEFKDSCHQTREIYKNQVKKHIDPSRLPPPATLKDLQAKFNTRK